MAEDPNVEANFAEIARLKQAVSPLFQKGWANAHPMPEAHRAMIEKAFSQKQATSPTAKAVDEAKVQKSDQEQAEAEAKRKNMRQGPTQSM